MRPYSRFASPRRAPTGPRDRRVIVIQVLVISLLATLLGRLAYVQFVEGGTHRVAADSNSVREVVTSAPRGLILDQVGRPLVANKSALVVTVDRAELSRQPDRGTGVLAALGEILGTSGQDLSDRMKPCGTAGALSQPLCWNGPSTWPVVVADRVAPEVGLTVVEQHERLPGVRATMSPVRAYPSPHGSNGAHLVGYLGQITDEESKAARAESDQIVPEAVGRSGLEQQYDQLLGGSPGVQRVALNRNGQANATLADTSAVPGDNLVTNIDARLQGVVEAQLQAALDRARKAGMPGDSGAAVVLDATNGRVLALASAPTYDPGVWVGGISNKDYDRLSDPNGGTPLLNRATQGQYAPASTFKVVSSAAAAQSGFSLGGTYPCPSSVSVGGQVFSNYESRSYGPISLARALAVSCDTVFYRLALQMWERDGGLNPTAHASEPVANAAKDFGFGKRTGIDLPGESRGRVVNRATKRAQHAELKDAYCRRATQGYPEEKDDKRARLLTSYAKDYCVDGAQFRAGDAVNQAIGQGDTVATPLQVATAYAAIANGGTLWQPQIVRAATKRDGTVSKQFEPKATGQLKVPSNVLDYIRSALARTPIDGTASNVFRGFPLGRIPIAAKTGTGEVDGKENTSWFVSFAPADEPRYVVLFMVAQGGTGSGTSGPSVRGVYEALFGVAGGSVDPSRSVLVGGEPSDSIPQVSEDGMGVKPTASASATPSPSQTPPGPSPAPSPPPPSVAPGGESRARPIGQGPP